LAVQKVDTYIHCKTMFTCWVSLFCNGVHTWATLTSFRDEWKARVGGRCTWFGLARNYGTMYFLYAIYRDMKPAAKVFQTYGCHTSGWWCIMGWAHSN
jgi:hypothetical protein